MSFSLVYFTYVPTNMTSGQGNYYLATLTDMVLKIA